MSSQHSQHDSEVGTKTHDEKTHYNSLFLERNDRSIDRSKDVFEERHFCAFFQRNIERYLKKKRVISSARKVD